MEKKKFRFNLIDAIILLIIAAGAALLVYVFFFSNKVVEKYDKYQVECVVEITKLSDDFTNKLQKGDPVINPANNKKIGTVTEEPSGQPSRITAFDDVNHVEVSTLYHDANDYRVTFVGTAEKTDWGYRFEDMYITVNDNTIALQIGDLQCTCTCIEMKVIG